MKYMILQWLPDKGWFQVMSHRSFLTEESLEIKLISLRRQNPSAIYKAVETLDM